MLVEGSESVELPRATARACQQSPSAARLSGNTGAGIAAGHGGERREGHGMAGEVRPPNNLLEGYRLEYSESDVVLNYDLSDRRQWKKRVWPRRTYPRKLFRWNTTEEMLSYLISFDHHDDWISTTVPQKPPSGSILFFHRKQTKRYRMDGYEWKTRKTTNTVREDRMKLKVGGYQLLYGCYAHSASNPNFHRRSYWLIQNPDLIMVHYLELDSSDGFGAVRQNSILDMEQSIEPSSWSLLTISDCNLCALLSMVQTSESTKTLLTQLTSTLDQNLQRALTLEEAIVMNNNGLPEDMFKDTRSRKVKSGFTNNATSVGGSSGSSRNGSSSSKKDMEPGILQAAMSNLSTDSQRADSSRMAVDSVSTSTSLNSTSISTPATPMSTLTSTPTLSVSTAAAMPLDSTKNALDVLSKSAHIIVCCQKPGSLSYILTVPTSSTSSTSSIPTPIPTPGRRILPSPRTRVESSCNILNKFSGLIKPSKKCGKGSSKQPIKNPSQGESSCKAPSLMSDYDAEKFSKFANILVNMDSIEGLQVEGCESEEDAPCNQHNQQQPQQLPQNGIQVLTSSGSDADFINSLGREASVVTKVECVKDCETIKDLASIVNSAIGSDQMSVETSDHTDFVLPLLPEVPMSWLKMDSTDIELNDHQDTSEKMEAVESNEAPCVSTVTSFSATSSSTVTTASIRAHTPSSAPVMDVQIFNQPLVSSESTFTSTDITPRPPPQSHPTANGKDDTKDCLSAVDTQVHAEHVADEPMSESMPHNNTDASDDFLNVSLDLDPESLQQLLMLSHSPESHHLSNQQQQSLTTLHPTISTETAPLSPMSQLFDRLEPATIISPEAELDLSDSHLPNEHRCHDNNENPDHAHTHFNGHTHVNFDVDFQQSTASHGNQTVTLFGSSNDTESAVPGLGSLPDAANTSSIWTPSPNSLQRWLESTSGAFGDGIPPSTSSESTTTVVAPSPHQQPQAMEVDDDYELTAVKLPQDLRDSPVGSSEPAHQSNSTATDMQYSHSIQSSHPNLHSSDSSLKSVDGSCPVSEEDFSLAHQSEPNYDAMYDSTEDFPGPFDVFCAHPDQSVGLYKDGSSTHAQIQRKVSSTSICSEPLPFDSLRVPSTMYGAADSSHHRLSLPNLANLDVTNDQGPSSFSEPSQGASPIQSGSGGFTSSPCSHRSISPGVALPDIPEGVQVHSPITQFDPNQFGMDMLQYRTSSPVPSSPSIASVSSRSTVSTHEFFENESPSVVELCELLSESPNVRHQDFSHLVLSESEQQQLFHSAQVIQNAFRKYKSRRQTHDKEKSAALLIENCYKNYVQMKREKERAARRIQQQYRIYKSRTKELNRAAVFIQQMYRYQKHRRVPPVPTSSALSASSSDSQSTLTTPPPTNPT